jgi:glucose/arabinose dehydrogenase
MKYGIVGWFALVFIFVNGIALSEQEEPKTAYGVESIPMPDGLTEETGAIEFLPDGRLVACFLRGEVMIYTPKSRTWKLFADGLHEPLGISVVSNSEFLIMQRPELTRIKDTDGDGRADVYETMTDDFGVSGNYHEYNYGPLKNTDGSFFVAFNTASYRGKVMKKVRGAKDTLAKDYKAQMFSPVAYRGWVMQLTPDGKLLPYASGFRSPNGLCFDLNGNLFATDNQGDWVGTTPLYHVEKGKFYGHPGSLVWEKNWNRGDPYMILPQELDKMRTRASVLFPHNIIANSLTQPVCDATKGKFGPFEGQLFIGEMNEGKIVRVMLEEVGGEIQGACTPFLTGQGLRKGNNRLAFAPDGSLWVGQAAHGWPGDRGIQRIVYSGKLPVEIKTMSLTATGFDLTFTQPLDAQTAGELSNYQFRHYFYEYHKAYGSDQFDVQNVTPSGIQLSADLKKVSLTLPPLKKGYIYELKLANIQAKTGEPLANTTICYTVNALRE